MTAPKLVDKGRWKLEPGATYKVTLKIDEEYMKRMNEYYALPWYKRILKAPPWKKKG